MALLCVFPNIPFRRSTERHAPLAPGNPRLRADVGGGWATVSDPLGTVNLSILSGGLAAIFATTSSPAVFVGPRVEIGYARGSGTASATGTKQDRGGRAIAASLWWEGCGQRSADGGQPFSSSKSGRRSGGLDVLADERSLAEMHGAIAGASAGITYASPAVATVGRAAAAGVSRSTTARAYPRKALDPGQNAGLIAR